MNNHVIIRRPHDGSISNVNIISDHPYNDIDIERIIHQFHNCIEIVAVYRNAHDDAIQHCNNIIHIP